MSPFSSLNRRANEAKSIEDLSRVAHEIETTKKLNKVERVVLDRAMSNRRQYLALAAVTP